MISEPTEGESLIDGESLWDLRTNPWDPPSERMVTLMHRLSYYFKRNHKLYRDFYEFDIDGKPQKYKKSDIYLLLNELVYELRINKEWFYGYLATHTNLADNQSTNTVKQMMKEYNPNKKR